MSSRFQKVQNRSKRFKFQHSCHSVNRFFFPKQASCLFRWWGVAHFFTHIFHRLFTWDRTLRLQGGNFPPAFSTEFIPACASYFLSYSAHFLLLCHSCCSFATIVPPSSQKETLSVWQRQHPVCQWSPKNFLNRSGTHLLERENKQGVGEINQCGAVKVCWE